MKKQQILKCNCKTIDTIQLKDKDLFITFLDGSIRKYSDAQKHYSAMLRNNLFNNKVEKAKLFGVGIYYRKHIRDKRISFLEIKKPVTNKNIGK